MAVLRCISPVPLPQWEEGNQRTAIASKALVASM